MAERPSTSPQDRRADPVAREPGAAAPGGEYPGAPVGQRRDLVRWGPVFAGLLVTITTLVVMTVLGLAIGLSAFEPDAQGLADADTAATIWGIVSAVVAFFLGGFTAGRTAAVGGAEGGVLNGLLVGVAAISAMVLLVGMGVGNAVGAAATNVDQIAEVIEGVQVDAGEATTAAQAAFENAEAGAWGTVIGLIAALGLSTLGGLVGRRPTVADERAEERSHAGRADDRR